jgi:hypothetical protein
MAYLGNAPARSFISFERQVFTIVNSQTAYTLSHSVTNENDIRLVINNIVQEPGSGKAYTASGTTLTLSAALTNGTDEMYCVFLGRATATNAPGAGSVNTAAIAADAITEAKIADGAVENEHLNVNVITGQTAETSIATDDTILIHDTSASALRKMTRANFVSGIGGTNTPAFLVSKGSDQSVSNGTTTKITFDNEVYDVGSCFASNKFTVPSGEDGKYFLYYNIRINAGNHSVVQYCYAGFRKNGSELTRVEGIDFRNNYGGYSNLLTRSFAIPLVAGDYIEVFMDQAQTSGTPTVRGEGSGILMSTFGGYKIIE